MVRILQIFGEPLSNGGQESFIMNMYRNIDRAKVQFDFYTPFFCDNKDLREEIENMGGRIYCSNGSFLKEGNKKDFIKGLKTFLNSHKYEIVHINSGSVFALAFGAKIAKKSGAKRIIVHSHATGINNIKYRLIKNISEKIFLKNATDYLACSKKAAEWKFPQKIIKENKYSIVKNGIELDKFKYDENIRKKYRKKLNIKNNDFVIGNVGRIEISKNHKFLLELFREISINMENAKLLIVGTGTQKNEIVNYIKNENLEDKVILLGERNDVNNILQAMDIFIFPSMFEGLGIVSIEAQAAGLITICSENIPEEADVTRLFIRLNLNDDKKIWIDKVKKNVNYKRINCIDDLRKNGYDAKNIAKSLESIYLGESLKNGES